MSDDTVAARGGRPTILELARRPGGSRALRGAVLLLAAGPAVRLVHGGPPPRGALVLTRLLGLREVVQGGVLLADPSPRTRRISTVVDALHLVSMLPLVAVPGTRRLGTAGAAGAVLDLLLRSGPRPDDAPVGPGQPRRRIVRDLLMPGWPP